MMETTKAVKLARMRQEAKQRGKLYLCIRKKLGLTQVDFARYVGCDKWQVIYRETDKVRYTLDEVVKLRQVAGMTWDEYGKLLEELS